MSARRTDADTQRSLAALALCAEDSLLDLLLEDGLVSVEEARREHTASELFALLRRIFGAAPTEMQPRSADNVRPHRALSPRHISLRAPPCRLCA